MALVSTHAPGAFCWVELGTSDLSAAKRFYQGLFAWGLQEHEMAPGEVYSIFQLKERDAAAAYQLSAERQPGVPPHWMIYVATANADATSARSVELGGSMIAPPFDVGEIGRMGMLIDPTGAAHTVWQGGLNPGVGILNEPGAFCWGQLNTSDPAKAEAYYKALFGWTAKTGSGADGVTYTEWSNQGVPIGGMMQLPPGSPAPSHWLPYFSVANCDEASAKAQQLGAQVYVAPTDIPHTGRFAVFADPQGAVFAVFQSAM